MQKNRYSEPVLFIPKVNGKPSVAPGKVWYVSFYWRTYPQGPLDKKFTFQRGINRYKTVKERKIAGKSLRDGYAEALRRGWNPETKKKESTRKSRRGIKAALNYALEIKKRELKEKTLDDYEVRLGIFMKWLKKNSLIGASVEQITIDHIHDFLDYLQMDYRKKDGTPLSNSSIDNTRRVISSLFTQLKKKRIIPHNFVKDIPKFKSKPVKNKPFTISELERVTKMLEKKEPYLVYFIAFMLFPVLRPIEVVRLKVKDLNTEDWILGVETKTSAFSYSRIITKMRPIIEKMGIEDAPGHYSLFTKKKRPAIWNPKRISSKVNYFSNKFTAVIREMGFGPEYTLYSVRHTAIWDLYHGQQAKGLNEREIIYALMPITGHSSEAGLRNYLRELQVMIPPDHSDLYTINI